MLFLFSQLFLGVSHLFVFYLRKIVYRDFSSFLAFKILETVDFVLANFCKLMNGKPDLLLQILERELLSH